MVEFDQTVEYLGADDDDLHIFHGHPGRLFDISRVGLGEVYVAFVNGPSMACRPDALAFLPEDEYLQRGRRLVERLHPLNDRPVRGLMMSGHEWPEGGEPNSGQVPLPAAKETRR